MYNVAVNVPEAVLYDTHMDERQVSMFAKRSVAVVYYTMMGVSLCGDDGRGFRKVSWGAARLSLPYLTASKNLRTR